MTASTEVAIDLRTAEQFLYREARLADEHDYDSWEALWTDDAIYWIPAGGSSDVDPTAQVSIVFDNRSRIHTRVAQLKSGKRHSQSPPSSVRRMVTNVEVLGADDAGDTLVGANFLAAEARDRGTTLWAGRADYRLRRIDGEVRLAWKKVTLIDRDRPLPTLSFLI